MLNHQIPHILHRQPCHDLKRIVHLRIWRDGVRHLGEDHVGFGAVVQHGRRDTVAGLAVEVYGQRRVGDGGCGWRCGEEVQAPVVRAGVFLVCHGVDVRDARGEDLRFVAAWDEVDGGGHGVSAKTCGVVGVLLYCYTAILVKIGQ